MFHTQSWAEALAAKPGNQVLSFDTSHWVMVDAPERFNQTVYGWLEG